MLKFAFNFRTRGVRVFCVAGLSPDQKYFLASCMCYFICQCKVFVIYVWLQLITQFSKHKKYVDRMVELGHVNVSTELEDTLVLTTGMGI